LPSVNVREHWMIDSNMLVEMPILFGHNKFRLFLHFLPGRPVDGSASV